MKSGMTIMVLLMAFAITGCAGMEKPNLNKIFKISKKEKVTSSASSGGASSAINDPLGPIMKLDEWIRENMW